MLSNHRSLREDVKAQAIAQDWPFGGLITLLIAGVIYVIGKHLFSEFVVQLVVAGIVIVALLSQSNSERDS